MKNNVGTIDKTVRMLMAVALVSAGVYFQSPWGIIALIPLLTALSGKCPLYRVFGLSSCPLK